MKNKKCTSCNKIKFLSEFGKRKDRNSGYRSGCKECAAHKKRKYNQSKDGLVTKIYSSQLGSSRKRNHKPPTYSKQELKDWLYSQPLFHKLYDNWKRLDYQKDYVPSVDRKDDELSYTIDNIKLMTWKENNHKASLDTRIGKLNHGLEKRKAVCQYDIDNNYIKTFCSIMEAERNTNISHESISSCCRNKRKTAGGFIWKFKQENNNAN